MSQEVLNALRILLERKKAAGLNEKAAQGSEEALKLILLGTDLDSSEILWCAARIGRDSLEAHLAPVLEDDGLNPDMLIEKLIALTIGLWTDGLITGVVLAQQREKNNRDPTSDRDNSG